MVKDGVLSSVPIGQGLVDFPAVLAELKSIAAQHDRFVLAMEMDLDEGDPEVEDAAVRTCARYMAEWYRNNQGPLPTSPQ